MIAGRNGKATRAKHRKEKRAPNPINSEMQHVRRRQCERKDKGADEKGTDCPVDFVDGNPPENPCRGRPFLEVAGRHFRPVLTSDRMWLRLPGDVSRFHFRIVQDVVHGACSESLGAEGLFPMTESSPSFGLHAPTRQYLLRRNLIAGGYGQCRLAHSRSYKKSAFPGTLVIAICYSPRDAPASRASSPALLRRCRRRTWLYQSRRKAAARPARHLGDLRGRR